MKRHLAIVALQLLSYAADGYYTQRNSEYGNDEIRWPDGLQHY